MTKRAFPIAVGFLTLGLLLSLIIVGSGFCRMEMSPLNVVQDEGSVPERSETSGFTFSKLGNSQGINYSSTFSANGGTMSNSGVYVTDYDGNGWPDILAIGGKSPILFENNRGKFSPANVIPQINGSIKAGHFLDYDADGDDDLLLLRTGASPVFLENRGGEFKRLNVGLSDETFEVPLGATSADYNGDGCLDLFIFQNGDWSDDFPGTPANRRAVLNGSTRPHVTDGNSNYLFRGTCGRFVNVTEKANIYGQKWSLAASFVDLTGDGYPDIHVANDFSHDVLYVNEENGSFRRVDLGRATDRNAMASEVADINRDGRPDLFITNIYFRDYMHLKKRTGNEKVQLTKSTLSLIPKGNNLLINRRNDSFIDKARKYGVRKGGWGWAASIADLNNDGQLDIIHTTSSSVPIVEYSTLGYNSPQIWEGTSGEFKARNATALGFKETNGRGIAALDFDRDGDLDIVIANAAYWQTGMIIRSQFILYENKGAGNESLILSIKRSGVTSIGAQVYVTTNETTRIRVLNAKSDFLSQEPRTLHVGLGSETVKRIRVVWPDGTERTFSKIPQSQFLVITPDGITPMAIQGKHRPDRMLN